MTMAQQPVVIVSLGAVTAVGRDAWASAAAVRAGISGFVQHPYLLDTAGEPMRAAIAPWIDIGLPGKDRLTELLLPAIDEALEPLRGAVPAPRLALALGLPGVRPGLSPTTTERVMRRVQQRFGHLFGSIATFEAGHAAGLLGLNAALRHLGQGTIDACLVAAADSWIEPETLEWLEAEDQLHGAGPLNNAWGFIPGEAGAALLLLREQTALQLGLPLLAHVLGAGQAHEPKRIKTQTVCIGEGLTEAFRAALQALPAGAKISDVYCDMNGEPYRADEFGFSVLRTKQHFESASDFVAPADCWGDVGAAGALLHGLLACVAARKGYANGPLAFVWSSAETGERAAAVLSCGDAAAAGRS